MFRARPPGLLQHVLTVLVFWSWVLIWPRLPPSSRSLRWFPWASILLHGPLDICLDLLPAAPLPPVQKRDSQHKFLQHKGAHADMSFLGGSSLPVFVSPFFLSCITVVTSVFGHSLCNLHSGDCTKNVQNHQRTSYDSKTGWAPARDGAKMAQKWRKMGFVCFFFFLILSILGPFLPHFRAVGHFLFFGQFLPPFRGR